MQVLDGKQLSQELLSEIGIEVQELQKQGIRVPHLAAVLVGNDGASETYVANKVKNCQQVGFISTLLRFPETISEVDLLSEIAKLNTNPDIDGFIVQLPIPKHISTDKVTQAILPEKDVDGFHPTNFGRMALNMSSFIPATPYGILMMIERYGIKTEGKHCVIVGRSNIVGSPMSMLMARNAYPGNCSVTLTHSRTANLASITQQADILIVALGKPEFITADMVKDGAVVIDVGITRLADASKKTGFALKGDVDYASVASKCAFITPVPGGVGPMTIVGLLKNTLLAAKNRKK